MAAAHWQSGGQTGGSHFEDNYLVRTLGPMADDVEFALTELVANAWDAGASLVDLTIPVRYGEVLTIEDDGHGMTAAQFRDRWMKLGYDRLKHQGATVEFPPSRSTWRRHAYGRHGVGRHGLLCFAERYTVDTWRDGEGARFGIGIPDRASPLTIEREETFRRHAQGTRVSVIAARHLPDVNRIREGLASRFLHDPQFVIRVNGESVALADLAGAVDRTRLTVDGCPPVAVSVVDVARPARWQGHSGISLWVNGRQVGAPSWVIGSEPVIDGRGRFAERYALVVQASEDWLPEVDRDWRRLRAGPWHDALLQALRHHARAVFMQLGGSLVDESSEAALAQHREAFGALSRVGRAEIAMFARELAKTAPTMSGEALSAAVRAAIRLEQSRGGAELLGRLATLAECDIDGLNRLLSQWTVRDAITVLDEIDHRLALIATIEKLSADPSTDELHVLHPLVTQARWLFGPEFDSVEYASNVTLRTAAEKIFKKRLSPDAFAHPRKRPDLLMAADATFSIVGTESFGPGEETLARHRHVLIVELKRGGHEMGRGDLQQADSYLQDFYFSGAMDGATYLTAFVVGHTIASNARREVLFVDGGLLRGKVQAVTYGQLTRSAHRRLLRLKDRIPARYEEMAGADLSARVMRGVTAGTEAAEALIR